MPMIPVDTAVQVIVGPLIDDADFKSLETGVAYNAPGMSVDLLKSSITGTPTKTDLTLTTAGSQDWIELGNGMYYIEITAAQNNVEGELQVVGVATGILPFISPKYQVVPVTVFNSLVAGSDTLAADVTQIGGDAQSATDLKDFADAGYDPATNKVQGVVLVDTTTTNTDMVAAAPTAAAVADAVWDEAQSEHVGVGTFGETATEIASILDDTGTAGVVVAAASKSGYDLNADQSGVTVGTVNALGASAAATVNTEVDNALDTAIPGTPTAGSLNDVIKDLDALLPGAGTLSVLAASDVNTQMLDVLKTDTSTLPAQVAPPATPTFEEMLMYLYKAWRNKSDQTSSLYQLYDDAGTTVDQKATVSDAAGTTTKGEVGAGP